MWVAEVDRLVDESAGGGDGDDLEGFGGRPGYQLVIPRDAVDSFADPPGGERPGEARVQRVPAKLAVFRRFRLEGRRWTCRRTFLRHACVGWTGGGAFTRRHFARPARRR